MTATKLRIRDLVEGTFEGNHVRTVYGNVSEARILGTLIDVFATDDRNYLSLTVDDGTETVRVKAWRQDTEKLKKVQKGDFIEVVGKVREYNEEIYLTPEVVSKVSPNEWILRELELMKQYVGSGVHVQERTGRGEGEDFKTAEEIVRETEEMEEVLERERAHPPEPEAPGKVLKEEREEKFEKESEESLGGKEGDKGFEEFEILGEDEVVETVLDLVEGGITKEELIVQSGLDEIDVELALRELMDEKRIKKEGNIYKKVDSHE